LENGRRGKRCKVSIKEILILRFCRVDGISKSISVDQSQGSTTKLQKGKGVQWARPTNIAATKASGFTFSRWESKRMSLYSCCSSDIRTYAVRWPYYTSINLCNHDQHHFMLPLFHDGSR